MPTTRKWSDLPLAVRRIAWWWLLPFLTVIGGVLVFKYTSAASMLAGRGIWMAFLLPLVVFVPFVVTIVMASLTLRRMRRAYIASDGHLCTICTQDVQGLGESGTCPECGRPFDIERDRAAWTQAGIAKAR